MAEEDHHHHHHFHHEKEEETPEDLKKEIKHHKHIEHTSETLVVTAGVYAMKEKHKAKKDTDHALRHKVEEKVAMVVAAGAGEVALHEHHEVKEAKHDLKEEEKKLHPHHHFPFFGSHSDEKQED